VLFIDLHALHERILFEQIKERIRSGRLEKQRLLVPQTVDLSANQAALVLEQREALAELGLEVEPFGGGTVALGSYPALLVDTCPGPSCRWWWTTCSPRAGYPAASRCSTTCSA
jgi:DNA mismatch repair protein MutL